MQMQMPTPRYEDTFVSAGRSLRNPDKVNKRGKWRGQRRNGRNVYLHFKCKILLEL